MVPLEGLEKSLTLMQRSKSKVVPKNYWPAFLIESLFARIISSMSSIL